MTLRIKGDVEHLKNPDLMLLLNDSEMLCQHKSKRDVVVVVEGKKYKTVITFRRITPPKCNSIHTCIKKTKAPALTGVSSCALEGHRLDSRSGHIPGLRVRYLTLYLFHSPSPLSLSKNQ